MATKGSDIGDSVFDLQNDEPFDIVVAILSELQSMEGADPTSKSSLEEQGAIITEREDGKTLIEYDDEARYHIFTGLFEHGDYKAGYLFNYLRVGVRAKNDYVGKCLVWLLHEALNGGSYVTELIDQLIDSLNDRYPNGLTVGGKRLAAHNYPVWRILDEIQDDLFLNVVKHESGAPIIHKLHGYKKKIVVKRDPINIDLWDIYRIGQLYGVHENDERYDEW